MPKSSHFSTPIFAWPHFDPYKRFWKVWRTPKNRGISELWNPRVPIFITEMFLFYSLQPRIDETSLNRHYLINWRKSQRCLCILTVVKYNKFEWIAIINCIFFTGTWLFLSIIIFVNESLNSFVKYNFPFWDSTLKRSWRLYWSRVSLPGAGGHCMPGIRETGWLPAEPGAVYLGGTGSGADNAAHSMELECQFCLGFAARMQL